MTAPLTPEEERDWRADLDAWEKARIDVASVRVRDLRRLLATLDAARAAAPRTLDTAGPLADDPRQDAEHGSPEPLASGPADFMPPWNPAPPPRLRHARAAAPESLDAAWAEVEAALPEGWQLALHSEIVGVTAACAHHQAWTHDSNRGVVVDATDGPAAALRALAAALRAAK